MKNFILYNSIILISIILVSCSDIREDIPQVPDLSMHKVGFTDPGSPNFHGNVIRNLSWNMTECKKCHAADFAGGYTGSSCLTCHSQTEGPEACNTCHGNFTDPSKIAPPRALSGALLSSERGVGAHNKHLFENTMGVVIECNECHKIPTDFNDPAHIDNTPGAELVFGDFTKLRTNVPDGFNYQSSLGDFIPNPSFNYEAGTCSGTYCHGYFKNGNLDNVVLFTAQSQGSACGTCHGDPATGNPLPKTVAEGGTHPPNENCGTCHVGVVEASGGTFTIIDKTKHMNGKLNIFNQEHVF